MYKKHSNVWSVRPSGQVRSSYSEEIAANIAAADPETIYFFAELTTKEQASSPAYHDDETMLKVYRSLESVGLSENKIIEAVTKMQNQGIYFREHRES